MSDNLESMDNMLGVRVVESPDEFGIAVSPELPGMLLLVLIKDKVALAFPVDSVAEILHDRICFALEQMLNKEGQEAPKGPEKAQMN